MTYNAKYNDQKYKYRTDKFKRVGIDFDKEYYNEVLKPASDRSGLPVGTYIKKAIEEKIQRDSSNPK